MVEWFDCLSLNKISDKIYLKPAFLFHFSQPIQTPFQRFSRWRSGTYNNAVTAIAISMPMSPVVRAIGPSYQT